MNRLGCRRQPTFFFLFSGILGISMGLSLCSCKEESSPTATKPYVQPSADRPEWQERIAKPQLTQDEFTQLVAERIASECPEASVTIKGPLEMLVTANGTEYRCFLHNAWKQCADKPLQRSNVCSLHLASLKGTLARSAGADQELDKSRIVPVVKDTQYLRDVGRLSDGKSILMAKALAADLYVVYAIDGEGQIRYPRQEDFHKAGLDIDHLHALAVANLDRIIGKVERHGEGPTYMLTADGTYEASLLLLDDIWVKREKDVKGNLVAAVPCRDVLLYTGDKSGDGVQKLRQAAVRLERESAYPISTRLLIRRDRAWTAFDVDGKKSTTQAWK